MSELINVVVSAAGLTIIFMGTSFYYWVRGRRAGVSETIALFYEHDPECVKRLDKALRKELNVDI